MMLFSNMKIIVMLITLLHGTFVYATNCAAKGTVVTTGKGRRSVKTSIVRIRAGVAARGENASYVHYRVSKSMMGLVKYLNSSSVVTKFETTGVSLNPVMNYSSSIPEVVGYSGANSVSFEVPVASAGSLLDGAVANGATRIIGFEFKSTPRVAEHARIKAVEDAVGRAYDEAHAAARAAGNSIGNVSSILINDQHQEEPIRANFMKADDNPLTNEAATTYLPKQLVISARVTVTYNIM